MTAWTSLAADGGYAHMEGAWWLWAPMMVIAVVAVLALVVGLTWRVAHAPERAVPDEGRRSREIAHERFARGEIDAQYDELRERLP